MCSLPFSYATFRDKILSSCDTLTLNLNEVYEPLFSKEKMKQLIVGSKAQGDNMFVRERPQEKNSSKEQRKRSNSRMLIKFAITARKMVTSGKANVLESN